MIDITTPSGYKVQLKEDITFGQFLELQKVVSGNMHIDAETQKVSGIDAQSTAAYMRKRMEYMIVKIVMPNGDIVENIMGCVEEMPRKDGLFIQEKISELSDEANPAKKKSTT